MTDVSGTNDRWLQKGVALPIVYEKMEPYLMWAEHLIKVKEEDNAFMYVYDDEGKSGDTKKKTPPRVTRPGQFPEIDRSVRSVSSAVMESHGFAMRIKNEVIRHAARGQAEIMDCYDRAGFWMAEFINTEILTALTGNATTPDWAPTTTWDGATATPVADLISLGKAVRREGYPFRFTDGFMNETCWYELANSVVHYDADFESKKNIFGIVDVENDTIYVPAAKCTIHLVMSGMSDGYILALDKNNKAAELHFYNDPKYSQPKVRYETMVNSKKTTITVPNIGINFRQYVEQASLDTILEFWYENKAVVTKPYGVNYDNGI